MGWPDTHRCAENPSELAFVQKIVAAINRDDKEARKSLMHPDVLVCDQALKQAMAKAAYVPKQSKIPSGYRWKISPMPAGNEDMAVAKGVVKQLMQEGEARIGK